MVVRYKPRPERWPQVSLLAYFVLATLLGAPLGWLGWNVHLVHERQAVRLWVADHNGWFNSVDGIWYHEQNERDGALSWVRRTLGDRASVLIELPANTVTIDEIHHVESAFPEAKVCVGIPGGPKPNPSLKENCVTLYNWPPKKPASRPATE